MPLTTSHVESGKDMFMPPPRARSEASFSEFHYDNSDHPPAGVCSSRLWEVKQWQAKSQSSLPSARDELTHGSQVSKVIRMTPQQEYNSQFETLSGPRIDPAKMGGYAGDMSAPTKAKVTLLGNHDNHAAGGKDASSDGTKKGKRAQGFILDNPRKSPAACAPPSRSTDPLRPQEEKFQRVMKRNGYKIAESRWTWNECHEVTGQDPQFKETHDPATVFNGMSSTKAKLYTSVKGQKKYNICGAQDMIPAATRPFAQSDNPPSARHIYENDKKYLSGFERGARPKGVPEGEGTTRVEFCGESPEMWNCMSGQERPLNKWRTMSSRGGQANWMDSAEQYYAANEDSRGRMPATLNSARSPSLRSPGSSVYDSQYMDDGGYQGDTTRSPNPNRRSLLYSPSDAGSRVSIYSRDGGRGGGGGSQTSRASIPSSARDMASARWR